MSTACRINSLLRQNFVKKEDHANGDTAGHTTNSLPTPPTPYMHKTRTFLEKKKHYTVLGYLILPAVEVGQWLTAFIYLRVFKICQPSTNIRHIHLSTVNRVKPKPLWIKSS